MKQLSTSWTLLSGFDQYISNITASFFKNSAGVRDTGRNQIKVRGEERKGEEGKYERRENMREGRRQGRGKGEERGRRQERGKGMDRIGGEGVCICQVLITRSKSSLTLHKLSRDQ